MPPRMPVKKPAVSVEDLLEFLRAFVLIINSAMAEAKIQMPRISLSVVMPLSVNQDKEIKPTTKPIMLEMSIGFRSGPIEIRGDLLK